MRAARFAAAANDDEGLGNANQHFHGAIVALAGSRRLNTIMSQVLAEMRLFFHKATVDAHFYSGYLKDNEEICAALEAGDATRLRILAHTIKGAVSHFGAQQAYDTAYQLELMAKNGNLDGAPAACTALGQSLQRLQIALRDICERLPQ